jgi:hypothetical protein
MIGALARFRLASCPGHHRLGEVQSGNFEAKFVHQHGHDAGTTGDAECLAVLSISEVMADQPLPGVYLLDFAIPWPRLRS